MPDNHIQTGPPWNDRKPSVVVFDVNETLIDIEVLNPLFERVFGDGRVLREWFGQLVLYSKTTTLSGLYEDYFSLGQGLFEMVGTIHGVAVDAADVEALREGLLTMPAHPDVEEGLVGAKAGGLSAGHPDEFAPQPAREEPAGACRPGWSFRATIQRRHGPGVQAVAARLSHGDPGTGSGAFRVLHGGVSRLGHNRGPKRRFLGRPDHPTGKCPADGGGVAAA